jgi:hypothetical protein
MILLLSSSIMYFLERGTFDEKDQVWLRVNPDGELEPSPFQSIIHSFYWAAVTLTTTGYGDIVPYTSWGRFVAGITMICGILVIAMPTSILGSSFVAEWTLHQRTQFLAKLRQSRQRARNPSDPKTTFSWRAKFLQRRNQELLEAVTEVQERLSEVNPTRYYQKYKKLEVQYEISLARINELEASVQKWKRLARNYEKFNNYQRRFSRSDSDDKDFDGDDDDDDDDDTKTGYGSRDPASGSKRFHFLPFRKTFTNRSTDHDETIDDNEQPMKEKLPLSKSTVDVSYKPKSKVKYSGPNPLMVFKRFNRSSRNGTSTSLPFNQRSSARSATLPVAYHDEYDNPKSVLTVPDTTLFTRAYLEPLRRASTLPDKESDSANESGVGSNRLADLFRRGKAMGRRGSSSVALSDRVEGWDKGKGFIERSAAGNEDANVNKGGSIDNDATLDNDEARIEIVVDNYENGRNSDEKNTYNESKGYDKKIE